MRFRSVRVGIHCIYRLTFSALEWVYNIIIRVLYLILYKPCDNSICILVDHPKLR